MVREAVRSISFYQKKLSVKMLLGLYLVFNLNLLGCTVLAEATEDGAPVPPKSILKLTSTPNNSSVIVTPAAVPESAVALGKCWLRISTDDGRAPNICTAQLYRIHVYEWIPRGEWERPVLLASASCFFWSEDEQGRKNNQISRQLPDDPHSPQVFQGSLEVSCGKQLKPDSKITVLKSSQSESIVRMHPKFRFVNNMQLNQSTAVMTNLAVIQLSLDAVKSLDRQADILFSDLKFKTSESRCVNVTSKLGGGQRLQFHRAISPNQRINKEPKDCRFVGYNQNGTLLEQKVQINHDKDNAGIILAKLSLQQRSLVHWGQLVCHTILEVNPGQTIGRWSTVGLGYGVQLLKYNGLFKFFGAKDKAISLDEQIPMAAVMEALIGVNGATFLELVFGGADGSCARAPGSAVKWTTVNEGIRAATEPEPPMPKKTTKVKFAD